jgi:hypothetical protein
MTDGACQQQLVPERFVITGHARFLAHDLQRNRLLRAPVVSGKDLTHSPFTETFLDLVAVIDDGAFGERRCFSGTLRHAIPFNWMSPLVPITLVDLQTICNRAPSAGRRDRLEGRCCVRAGRHRDWA